MTTIKKNSTEAWLDDLELRPEEMRDGANLRRIGEALDALEKAQQDLDNAVADAHAAGDSWAAIGLVLGTSRQAAHRKYGQPTGNGRGFAKTNTSADGAYKIQKGRTAGKFLKGAGVSQGRIRRKG